MDNQSGIVITMDQLMTLTKLIKLQARVQERIKTESDDEARIIYTHSIMSLSKESGDIIDGCFWKELPRREEAQ